MGCFFTRLGERPRKVFKMNINTIADYLEEYCEFLGNFTAQGSKKAENAQYAIGDWLAHPNRGWDRLLVDVAPHLDGGLKLRALTLEGWHPTHGVSIGDLLRIVGSDGDVITVRAPAGLVDIDIGEAIDETIFEIVW